MNDTSTERQAVANRLKAATDRGDLVAAYAIVTERRPNDATREIVLRAGFAMCAGPWPRQLRYIQSEIAAACRQAVANGRGIDWNDYERRVSALEAEGMTRSDAQGIVDMQIEGRL